MSSSPAVSRSNTTSPTRPREANFPSSAPRNLRWTHIACQGDIPAGRIGHTLCASKDESTVYLYGGVNETSEHVSSYLEELYSLDTATSTWTKISLVGQKQQPRAFHTAVMHNDLMYVFGGCNGRGRFNKLFSIDRSGNVVVVSPQTAPPATRYCHSAVLFEDDSFGASMYIFAGKCGGRNSNKRLSDLYRFDLYSNAWHPCPQFGTIPPSRSAHAAFTFGRQMIIFGGRNSNGECCEDLYTYSYDTGIWTQINTAYGSLIGRARHSVVLHNNRIVVFGGWNGKKKLNDLFFFNLETKTFDISTDNSNELQPSRRECHVAVICKNTMVVFGGRFRGNFMNDTFHLSLDSKSLKDNCRDWLLEHKVDLSQMSLPVQLSTYISNWKKLNERAPPPSLGADLQMQPPMGMGSPPPPPLPMHPNGFTNHAFPPPGGY